MVYQGNPLRLLQGIFSFPLFSTQVFGDIPVFLFLCLSPSCFHLCRHVCSHLGENVFFSWSPLVYSFSPSFVSRAFNPNWKWPCHLSPYSSQVLLFCLFSPLIYDAFFFFNFWFLGGNSQLLHPPYHSKKFLIDLGKALHTPCKTIWDFPLWCFRCHLIDSQHPRSSIFVFCFRFLVKRVKEELLVRVPTTVPTTQVTIVVRLPAIRR